MKKIYLGISLVILVALVFSIVILLNKPSPDINLTQNNSTTIDSSGSPVQILPLTDLAKHNTKEDCWVVYKNKVYDVTSWIPNHPGGESAIARTCGTTDFEGAFERKHGTSKASMFMKVTTYKGDFAI